MHVHIVLGNQLFDPQIWPEVLCHPSLMVFMREDRELCTYFRFHKHKLILFLSAMRAYGAELRAQDIQVHYEPLLSEQRSKSGDSSARCYEDALIMYLRKNHVRKVSVFEIEDKFFESRLLDCLAQGKVELEILPSPMFLTSRQEFSHYVNGRKQLRMSAFYQLQRKKLNVLMDERQKPIGGKWSFDGENRHALPLDVNPPDIQTVPMSYNVVAVANLVDQLFSDHPGNSSGFWLPVTRSGATQWLKHFIEHKLSHFGPYEDAMPVHSEFVFHSVLSPFLNMGLLTPQRVLTEVLDYSQQQPVPLSSLEGFVRQIIGWREFIRGVYQQFSDEQTDSNFWQHRRQLSQVWYQGGSSLPQLEQTLQKVFRRAYCHHIERLMVLGNLMVLLEIEPQQAHQWFMEMFVDSADWVMGPNVYGMALMSDGGIFATKPYICGSNYWLKMSKQQRGSWCDGLDGLYWQFIDKHQAGFAKNPRMTVMVQALARLNQDRKSKLFLAADRVRKELAQ